MSKHSLIKYKCAKFLYKFRSDPDLTETEAKVVQIFRQLLNRKGAELVVAPVSHKRYIKWEDMTAILHERMIVVSNHKYYYSIYLPDKTVTNIANRFDAKLEIIRAQIDNEVEENVNASLNTIIDNIKQDDKRKRKK